ncbi:MAG: DUF2341 domain-containing protein, partial [Canidatus Methanoxibalbensis ujae]|nr:DUF2341 domain-containing protein [Candidatus Methanoxibalbensis ujae]
ELNSTNFNFAHAQSNGEDIRFTNEEGNLLDYWIEEWDAVNETAKVWVKVPSIPANSSVVIYMYYGNPYASSASNGDATFEFFDDFSYKAPVLQKIYPCENGAREDNEDGKPVALHHPIQAIYDSSQNKVFIVYQGSGYDPYIFYYDAVNKTISSSVKVGDNPTADVRWGDAHGGPVLWIDPDGYIHVLYGGHGAPIKHSKSTNPYDISSWTLLSDFASKGTYPYPIANGSNVYVFFRKPDGYRYYKKSTDGGNTFGSDIQWMSTTGVYYSYVRKGNRVHFALMKVNSGELRYCYFDLTDDTFHKIDGTELSTPFAFDDADLAWTSPTGYQELAGIAVDDEGHIYIIAYARQSHNTPATEHGDVYAIKWNGSSWESRDTGLDVEFASGAVYLAVKSSTEMYLYFVEMDVNGCGAFKKYSSSNGLDLTFEETIAEIKTCRTVHTVYNTNIEPIGGITFNDIITLNNLDRSDPHIGLYGGAFLPEEIPALDTSKWSILNGGGSGSAKVVERDGEYWLELYAPDSSNRVAVVSPFTTVTESSKYIMETRVYVVSNADGFLFGFGDGTITSAGNDFPSDRWAGGEYGRDSNSYHHLTEIISGGFSNRHVIDSGSFSLANGEYYDVYYKHYADYRESKIGADLKNGTTTYTGLNCSHIHISICCGGKADFEYVHVRKYASPEPSVSVGAEETA